MAMPANKQAARVHPAAQAYYDAGFAPLGLNGKKALIDDWTSLEREDLLATCKPELNTGLQLKLSKLNDVDADCAAALFAARAFLPETAATFFRGNERGHFMYRGEIEKSIAFKISGKRIGLELRGGPNQTMVPPSTHPDTKQRLVWALRNGTPNPNQGVPDPAAVDVNILSRAVHRVACFVVLTAVPKQGNFHLSALPIVGGLALAGWKKEESEAFITALVEYTGQQDVADRLAVVASTYTKLENGDSIAGFNELKDYDLSSAAIKQLAKWATIAAGRQDAVPNVQNRLEVRSGDRFKLAHACQAHLGSQRKVFVRASKLVRLIRANEGRPVQDGKPETIKRDPYSLVIVPVEESWLQTILTESPGFYKINPQGRPVALDCPAYLASAVASLGEWPDVPVLHSIALAPFLRPDGTVCSTNGYDPESKVYLQSTVGEVKVPASPNWLDAVEAADTLLAPFSEFPFKRDTDLIDNLVESHKASFAAGILTIICRHMLDTVPIFKVDASTPGTGKTLLVICISQLANGINATVRAYPHSDDEMKKVLLGIALSGDSVVLFDNLKAGSRIRSDDLCGFSTAQMYGGRILGTTSSVSVPNVATVFVTGNNIVVAGELLRRVLNIELITEVEQPEMRTFAIPDLVKYIQQNRARLLSAALTWMVAYIKAGKPSQTMPLGSLEEWSTLVRDAVVWVGLPDPVITQQQATADDEERNAAHELLVALDKYQHKDRQGALFTTADLIHTLAYAEPNNPLREAALAAGMDLEKPGYWMRANRDRWFGPRQLYGVRGRHERWGIRSRN